MCKMYHAARTWHRDSIACHGLDQSRESDSNWRREHPPEQRDLYPVGNYLWSELKTALAFAGEADDVWAVDVDGLELAGDPLGREDNLYEGAFYCLEIIPAPRLKLVYRAETTGASLETDSGVLASRHATDRLEA